VSEHVLEPRLAYSDLDAKPLVPALERALREPDDRAAVYALAVELYPLESAPEVALAELVLGSDGPFARLARGGAGVDDRRVRLASRELDALGALAHGPIAEVLERHGLRDALPEGSGAQDRPPFYAELRAELAATPAWGDLVGRLSAFHGSEGTGALAAHRVLRLGADGLVGVGRPDPISLADLEGGEAQQAPLLRDLEAFIAGRGANDALLYGPPGTGKSATVRGLASVFADRGLRLVQVDRGEIERLGSVFSQLAGSGPHCLVYLDDLAFDDGGRTDRVLRAALEGGVVARPANVLVWVTSNRLRLTRETHAERADDIEGRLAVGEKTALATRFGRRVAFRSPSQEAYLAICRRLVRERLGTVPEGTDEAAVRFAVAGHGMTQRTARQFAAAFRPEEL
jgi:predicted AAA+ superfamily ATPase